MINVWHDGWLNFIATVQKWLWAFLNATCKIATSRNDKPAVFQMCKVTLVEVWALVAAYITKFCNNNLPISKQFLKDSFHVFYLHSGSLFICFAGADGNYPNLHFIFGNISKVCVKFTGQLDGGLAGDFCWLTVLIQARQALLHI